MHDRSPVRTPPVPPRAAVAEAPAGWCLFDTAIGPCGVAWSVHGLLRVQLPEANRAAAARRLRGHGAPSHAASAPPPHIARVIAELQRYADGARVDFATAPLDLAGIGAFQRRIYDAARAIPWGGTTTYGALARQAGSADAARAAGQALGRNPIPIIIPCHRILASGGKPGGFSAYGGAVTKQRLLALEGVALGAATPLLPGLLPAGG